MFGHSNVKKIICLIIFFGILSVPNYVLHGDGSDDATPILDQNFSLVQIADPAKPENMSVDVRFLKIVPDIHQLISRSYKSTKRASDNHYLNQYMLERDENVLMHSTGHHWHCMKNFQGAQGDFVTTSFGWRLVRQFIRLFSGGQLSKEVDYPGFVAYSVDSDPSNSIIWIVVVLRGSQGEKFQPGDGMFGGSWVTNYNAAPSLLKKEFYPFTGYAHVGYLNKILSCNISMRNAINKALEQIGQENFPKVRFVVTGHSQGGGLAQIALPIIIQEHGYIYSNGKAFNNAETPRFFGYFMSTPRAISGQDTANAYKNYVGENNMIRHQAHGDIVPMLCLSNYFPVGHLALDTLYDTACRAIRSEAAYCNRYMLFWSIKNLVDPAKFVIDEESNTWVSVTNPEFDINWTELCKVVCSQSKLHDMSTETMFKSFLRHAFAAAHPIKQFETARKLPDVSNEFLTGLLKDKHSMLYVEAILRNFVFFEDIELEEKKMERVFLSGSEIENRLGNFENVGLICAINNYRSLNSTSSSLNKMNDFEQFVNEDLKKIVPHDGIVLENRITPTGNLSLLAYAHYGSASNYFKSKLFDSNIPSKNLNLSLRNGYELLRTKSGNNERCIFVYEEPLPKILFDIINSQ